MKYHFKIRKESKGYWAECIELKGCVTQANTIKQLKNNMAEALNLYLDEPPSSKVVFPLPRKSKSRKGVVSVSVEPKVALAFLLRRARLERKLTQTQVAKLLGLSGLYSYQRLESSKTANPQFETIVKIKKVFPDLPIEELLAA